jgi:hypothetical protein
VSLQCSLVSLFPPKDFGPSLSLSQVVYNQILVNFIINFSKKSFSKMFFVISALSRETSSIIAFTVKILSNSVLKNP